MASAPDSSGTVQTSSSLKLRAAQPRSSNHFRPVALNNVSPDEGTGEDRPQAPPPPGCTERSLSHLEDAGNTVRITFFDFSSAFNTIHPPLTPQLKQGEAGESGGGQWVTSWLHGSPTRHSSLTPTTSLTPVCEAAGLCVRCGGLQHRCPQGTVLSPFLFTLYTSDFTYSTDSCHLQKFSDDTAIVGCVSEGNDCEYRKVIMDFVDWCELNHLQVNASKTKEMVIDFSRKPSADIAPLNIQGLDIERVRTYKYPGCSFK
ncbi:hypothetical protein L3Q82_006822 [Scortum barcoo]|uniref:Uncharacterized protein n=1 Tax=Scortum barcoo TaxID=214431 RepID=A0ACB8WWR1_9TELE|nr:hypothetical protein L3Q82_006822 [Scortum barcoo]